MARLTDEQKAEAPRNLANLWAWDVNKIHIEAGFNVRQEGPDLDAHIRWLANEMHRVGFDQTQPLAVVRDRDRPGHVIVRKGHCRFRGVMLAISEGAAIQSVPCLIEPKGTNAILQTYQFGTSNSGKALGYLDYAVAIMRLRAWGQTDEQIIAGYGKTKEWLADVLDLNEAMPEVHQSVKAGKISQTEAVKVVRRHGSGAGAVIKAAAKIAPEGRVRPRHVAEVEAATKPRTALPSLHSLVVAAVLVWEGGNSAELDTALDNLAKHIGPAALDAARIKVAA